MKKAQAAMEFLMTYGWAVLIVLVAVAALAYFGVLNSIKVLPEKTIFRAPLPNLDNAVVNSNGGAAGDGTVSIAFRNNEGHLIDITDISTDSADDCGGAEAGATKTISVAGSAPVQIGVGNNGQVQNGNLFVISFECIKALTSNERFKADIIITYTNLDSDLSKPHKGSIDVSII